jgi:hypothetical protein
MDISNIQVNTVNSIDNYNRFYRQHPEEEGNRHEVDDNEYSDYEGSEWESDKSDDFAVS